LQSVEITEGVGRLDLIQMLVIAFASFIVEANHTALICDVSQAVLEGMLAIRKWLRQLPNHNLYECATAQNQPFTHQ
jgi:hypothetical protein